jgi:hypothetical protein
VEYQRARAAVDDILVRISSHKGSSSSSGSSTAAASAGTGAVEPGCSAKPVSAAAAAAQGDVGGTQVTMNVVEMELNPPQWNSQALLHLSSFFSDLRTDEHSLKQAHLFQMRRNVNLVLNQAILRQKYTIVMSLHGS